MIRIKAHLCTKNVLALWICEILKIDCISDDFEELKLISTKFQSKNIGSFVDLIINF